ncbi:Tudor domain-containing protein [Strongyloides ratti]|uniref:Tudor domain-containing protein n=1 Tax=Strongyloides ratti TaxID=34506 RepID=A0A090L830_STRRB|nr:Tudor domain-containing protein [Strongyloides ratti]CEF64253.1 Tudor domain-containing protein [Strongyloides ratti]
MSKKSLQKFGVRQNTVERFILGNKYRIPYLIIPQKAYFKIVKVISPSIIIVKLLNAITESINESFDILYHTKLNIEDKFYGNIKPFCDDICEGFLFRYCLAPTGDNKYGRGRIVEEAFQLTNNEILDAKKFVKVFFIDTGDEGWFNVDSLYEIPIEKYLIPWQVTIVSLNGVTPSGDDIKYWNENVCLELDNILKQFSFVEIINTNVNINIPNNITSVKMIGFCDAKEIIGENIACKLFFKLPSYVRYTQFSTSNNIFDTLKEISINNDKKLFKDNIPIIESFDDLRLKIECKCENITYDEISNNKELKITKLKEKKKQPDVNLLIQKEIGILSYDTFYSDYKKNGENFYESLMFYSPQIPIWTEELLEKFNYIGTDNKMYLELLPFEETSFGEEIVKNPLEMHAAMLRYQPEDVVIREDTLYNTLELEYYSERTAFQKKLNYFYSQPGNICPLNQMKVLKDLNNGYSVYGIYFSSSDCDNFIANRIEVLSVELEKDINDNLQDKEILVLEYQELDIMDKNTKGEIDTNNNNNIFKSIKIRFLDYGGIVIVTPKFLSKIHSQFCFLPPFSIQINLIPLTQKICSIASEENREFILQYYDYFNAAIDLKTPMLAIFDSHQGTLRKKNNEEYVPFFEDNCEWEYNHVINISNMQRLFPRGIPIDMTIDSYINFLENNK